MWARMKKIDMVILTQIKTKNTTKCKKSKPLKILHQSRWWIIGIQSNELHSFWRYFYHVMIQEHMGNWIDLAPQAETVASWIIRLWTVKLILIMHVILFSNVACVTFVPLTFSRLDCLFVINGLLDLFGWCTTWAIGATSQDWSTSAKMTASTHGWIHAYHFGSSVLPDFCDIRCVLMLDSFQSNSPTSNFVAWSGRKERLTPIVIVKMTLLLVFNY
jgi:hypothetical protein